MVYARKSRADHENHEPDPEACAEVTAYAALGLLPPGWEAIAERMARSVAREWGADEHELRSAALQGAWAAANDPRVRAGECWDVRGLLIAYVNERVLRARQNRFLARGGRMLRRTVFLSPEVMAACVPSRPDGPPPEDRSDFWARIGSVLGPAQAEVITELYRCGGSPSEVARRTGRTPQDVGKKRDDGLRRLRWKLGAELEHLAVRRREAAVA